MTNERDWRWQLSRSIRTVEELASRCSLTEGERKWFARTSEGALPFSVTPYYFGLIDLSDPLDPIRRQCIPTNAEHTKERGQLFDPLGEEKFEVAPHLVRRYPDRALLLVTDRCATYCRHCTRRRHVGRGGRPSIRELRPAFRWLEDHREVDEVLISGGDPLVADTDWVDRLLRELRRIGHLGVLRVGTRVPVTLPMRVDAALCDVLRRHQPVIVTTHFNHPREMTSRAREACERLVDAGIPVANQAVLLRGVNDSARLQAALGRALLRARVRPYYLMQTDSAQGTSHFRTSVESGLRIMAELRRVLSGLAVPTYVLDLPGGAGKVPLTSSAVEGREGDDVILRSPTGVLVRYHAPTEDVGESTGVGAGEIEGRLAKLDRVRRVR